MSRRLAHWASQRLDRADRRRFLTRTAVAGSAMVVAPRAFALRPTSAYAAVCSCNGQRCDCSQLCCDGYTEFCCTIYGRNDCPPGTIVAGWWKADGSGYCDDGGPKPRYYLDCNAACDSGCGCGSAGVCASSCTSCAGRGRCANGNCNNRKTCRTLFRYGQCNNDVRCVGPIVCRVVTCTPPWTITKFDCNATPAVDNNTRSHHRACLLASDPTDTTIPNGATLLAGRWNSDAVAGPAYFHQGRWHLRTQGSSGMPERTFDYGIAGDIPVVGDWDGDGIDGIGVVRGNVWYLRDTATPGPPDRMIVYGTDGDVPVVGDWDGDGIDGIGVVRGDRWHLRNTLTDGPADHVFTYGDPFDTPVVGDWDGDGADEVGVVRDNRWLLRNTLDGGPADTDFVFGPSGSRPIAARWERGRTSPGIVTDSTQWSYRRTLTPGAAHVAFEFPTSVTERGTREVGADDDTVASE